MANRTNTTISVKSLSLVKEISESLLSLIEESKRLSSCDIEIKERRSSPFYCQSPPSISIHKYLVRILDNTQIDESTLVIALIYLDSLFRERKVIIDEYSIHRLIITSILLAIKYNEDVIYKASFYARVAGVTKKEIIILETQMLKTLDYKLYVDNTVYETYKNYFEGLLPQMKENSFFFSKQFLCL